MSEKITRYYRDTDDMYESADGPYVLFADHAAEIARLEAEVGAEREKHEITKIQLAGSRRRREQSSHDSSAMLERATAAESRSTALEAENRRLRKALEEARWALECVAQEMKTGGPMSHADFWLEQAKLVSAALTPAPASSGEQAVVPKGATTDLADMSDETRGKLLAIILPRQESTRDPIVGPGGWINCSYCGSLMNPASVDPRDAAARRVAEAVDKYETMSDACRYAKDNDFPSNAILKLWDAMPPLRAERDAALAAYRDLAASASKAGEDTRPSAKGTK